MPDHSALLARARWLLLGLTGAELAALVEWIEGRAPLPSAVGAVAASLPVASAEREGEVDRVVAGRTGRLPGP